MDFSIDWGSLSLRPRRHAVQGTGVSLNYGNVTHCPMMAALIMVLVARLWYVVRT